MRVLETVFLLVIRCPKDAPDSQSCFWLLRGRQVFIPLIPNVLLYFPPCYLVQKVPAWNGRQGGRGNGVKAVSYSVMGPAFLVAPGWALPTFVPWKEGCRVSTALPSWLNIGFN